MYPQLRQPTVASSSGYERGAPNFTIVEEEKKNRERERERRTSGQWERALASMVCRSNHFIIHRAFCDAIVYTNTSFLPAPSSSTNRRSGLDIISPQQSSSSSSTSSSAPFTRSSRQVNITCPSASSASSSGLFTRSSSQFNINHRSSSSSSLSGLRQVCSFSTPVAVRGRHSTSNLPVTPTPLALGFHHSTGEPGSSTQPPAVPFRSRPPFQPHLSRTPVLYEPYGSAHPLSHPTDTVYDPYLHAPTVVPRRIPYRSAIQEPVLEFRGQPRKIGVEFFDQMLGAAPQDSSCSTHGYSHAEYSVSSSYPYVLGPADGIFQGDRIIGEEQERVRSLHIQGEENERGDDDGDGGDDDQDDGDDDGDEEQTVYVAPVALAS
ncbi:hypothetical protein M9H77_27581 [Catharanthus roseus]|uniref:Uncharacterized protein n=1 Tax=Catharanthus roseus TaxID=4058 RepID=A0ACC0AFM4_CATRO|nr:hypothetical protein M9H77_27581 [Catharanthus roseus]